MTEAQKIKDFYIEPPIRLIERVSNLRQGRAARLPCQFEVQTKIWVDQYLPEWRVAIPENTQLKAETLEHWDSLYPIETRMITYVPTGRVVYDNTKPHAEAVVYEYILESLLGKREVR